MRAALVRSIFTVPSSDRAFADHVAAVSRSAPKVDSVEFERRLRRVFPRVAVRERSLSGEASSWYVYRDGSWRPSTTGPWWTEPGLPSITVSPDGWVVSASRTAADLLGVAWDETVPHHFTDFVVPGALEDAVRLFEVVKEVGELDATVLLLSLSREAIAVDMHVTLADNELHAVLRLATDVDIPSTTRGVADLPSLTFTPTTDVAFRAYTQRALERMPEPTPAGLELRLHQLYPHAAVTTDGAGWSVRRDRAESSDGQTQWWTAPDVARVRYDAEALILEANKAATELFGRDMVGHHWQEFVTAGSTEQVAVMLEILAEVGAAESRFRLPRPDGSLLEFDSYTELDGDEFMTAYRPVPGD